jgi:DNA excision repair protein ERCC-4
LEKKEESLFGVSYEDFENFFGVLPSPNIVIHSMTSKKRVLEDLKPKYVIMYLYKRSEHLLTIRYDPDLAFLRQIEVYRAENPGVPLRLYWLMYANSAEEIKHATLINKEKQAFEALIHEKQVMSFTTCGDSLQTMAISVEQDGKMIIDIEAPEDFVNQNTRKGGKQPKDDRKRKIIVDSREFRSALPNILYQREFDITPATLEVGDYILTPEICIERKSLSDLYQSLSSGRLYGTFFDAPLRHLDSIRQLHCASTFPSLCF